jgi:hypothetical protein
MLSKRYQSQLKHPFTSSYLIAGVAESVEDTVEQVTVGVRVAGSQFRIRVGLGLLRFTSSWRCGWRPYVSPAKPLVNQRQGLELALPCIAVKAVARDVPLYGPAVRLGCRQRPAHVAGAPDCAGGDARPTSLCALCFGRRTW